MNIRTEYDVRIQSLDVSLFDAIPSQSNVDDRRSWLALQRAVRGANAAYAYLEIGSHLGGSMQSHLMDPRCKAIYSIDTRCLELPDDRGVLVRYPDNSTDRMFEKLREIDAYELHKVHALDADAREVDPAIISEHPALCFIDGEHTKQAVTSDFEFCLRVCTENAVIYFHDDVVVHEAISSIVDALRAGGRRIRTAKLGGSSFAIGLGDGRVLMDEDVLGLTTDGMRFLKRQRIKSAIKRVTPAPLVPVVRGVGRRLYATRPSRRVHTRA